jgi:alkyl hydroperoxide reductase subunit AhpF
MDLSSEDRYKKIIEKEMSKLTKRIKLKVFTSLKRQQDGTMMRECEDCNVTMNLLNIYVQNSYGRLIIEELSIYDDLDFAKKYDIQRVPTILLIDDQEREIIRYLANPLGQETTPFVKSIFALAGGNNYFESVVNQYISRINLSNIRVFITMSCPYCPQVVSIVNLFTIASKGKLRSVIVDIERNPDIGEYFNVNGVPFTLINDQTPLIGMFAPQDLLKTLLGGNLNV